MNDFKMAKQVRGVLARLRLDTQRITIHFENGEVVIGGRIQFVNGVDGHRPELGFELLHGMDVAIRRLEGVKSINYTFDNWIHNSDGHWTRKQVRELTGPSRSMLQRLRRANPSANQI